MTALALSSCWTTPNSSNSCQLSAVGHFEKAMTSSTSCSQLARECTTAGLIAASLTQEWRCYYDSMLQDLSHDHLILFDLRMWIPIHHTSALNFELSGCYPFTLSLPNYRS